MTQTDRVFDRETLLDTLVNVVPLGIILFFVVLFAVFNPFEGGLLERVLQYGLLVVPFVLLAYLTYLIAERI